MRFMAIDSSTTSIAFSFWNDGELRKYGIIMFSGNGIYEKVKDASSKCAAVFTYAQVEHVVIESTFFGVNPKVTTDLAMAQGAILGAGTVHGVKHMASVTPIQWQNAIGNKALTKAEKEEIKKNNPGKSANWYKAQPRKIRKQRTIDFVNNTYGLSVTDDNVADAIAIGHYSKQNWSDLRWA